MTVELELWLLLIFGPLALIGYALSCLDYERKIDEGREINRRVLDHLTAEARSCPSKTDSKV